MESAISQTKVVSYRSLELAWAGFRLIGSILGLGALVGALIPFTIHQIEERLSTLHAQSST